MRKTTVCLVAVLMCAWVGSFGQNNGLPQWKVVKQFHLTDQTADVSPTAIFTPQKDGMYRVGMYVAGATTVAQATAWDIGVAWIDASTEKSVPYIFRIDLLNGSYIAITPPQMFRPKVGRPVTFSVSSDPAPHDATYDLAITIEKLTR